MSFPPAGFTTTHHLVVTCWTISVLLVSKYLEFLQNLFGFPVPVTCLTHLEVMDHASYHKMEFVPPGLL